MNNYSREFFTNHLGKFRVCHALIEGESRPQYPLFVGDDFGYF